MPTEHSAKSIKTTIGWNDVLPSLLQKLMELPEHHKQAGGQLNNNLAMQIKDGDFSWDVPNIDFKQKGLGTAPTNSSTEKLKNGEWLRSSGLVHHPMPGILWLD